jgi:hypothetical protein
MPRDDLRDDLRDAPGITKSGLRCSKVVRSGAKWEAMGTAKEMLGGMPDLC